MKIAIDHQIFNMQSSGGVSRYYTSLVQESLRLHQDIRVFAGIHCNSHLGILPKDVVRGYKLLRYPKKTGRVFRSCNKFWANRKIRNWSPHLIHETYYSNQGKEKSSLPRVTTVYDMIHEIFPENFPMRDETSVWKRKTIERVEHVISISHSTKKDLVKYFGVDEEKITVVHLGVDSSAFQTNNATPIETTFRPYLLFVGGRGGYKNFISLLNAFSSSTQLKQDFDLVAFGGGEFNSDERNMVSTLGFSADQIRHVSGSDDKLASLYSNASALVYPSLYEGFGLPVLEAMACSCPVISSSTSSMPEVVGDAGEYCDPSSLDDIRRAVECVVYSSTRSDDLIKRGLERVQLFGWKKCAVETIDVYTEIVDRFR